MSGNERHEVWRRAMRGDCTIVVGPRSAVFAPLPRPGLFVVDEEHDASYKQYDAIPRYHARDVAIVRASHVNAVVVLGTATPSAESYFNAMNGKYELLTMPHRIDEVPMPSISVVDMTAERRTEYAALRGSLPEEQRKKLRDFQQSSFSSLLREKIADRLSRKEGIILLQNRRGFAPFVECVDCGYAETCANCSITLTYHLVKKHLRCHYCGSVRAPHAQCPQCGGTNMHMRGIGTQRVEEELAQVFPTAKVLRMDLDTVSRKGTHDRLLRKFGAGEADILLGTQMVAKGLDFPRVTLVGVISADTQLLLPDFRSSERTFQLLTQVAGRAGRSALSGEVVIQTHQTRNHTIQHVVDHDFRAFYEQELVARRELAYPPFSRLALIETKGENEAAVRQESERFARLLRPLDGTFDVLGPSPAIIARVKNQYRWHIIVKSRKTRDQSGSLLRQALRTAMASFRQNVRRSVRVIIDCDPVGLM
jgi:primosomal protein N' (replication factor Y)